MKLAFDTLALVAGVLAVQFLPGQVQAQSAYPAQNLRIIVPFGPGSGPDPLARRLAERLVEQLGIPVVVETREGAGGQVGAQAIAAAPANGSAIGVVASPPFTSVPNFQKRPAYDPEAQFTHIARLMTTPLMIVGSNRAAFTNFAEMQDYAKKNPGKLTYATSGSGSASFLSMETVKLAAGVNVLAVPYKSNAQQMTDTIAGIVDMNVVSLAGSLQQVRSNSVRALAVGSEKRSPTLPNVPTLAEVTGKADLDAVVAYGVIGPRGIPEPLVTRLAAEMSKALETPQMVQFAESSGAVIGFQGPAAWGNSVRKSVLNARQVIQTLNLPLE